MENTGMLDKCPNKQTDKLFNLQTIEQHIGQNNDLIPVNVTAPKDVENR